MSGIWSYSPTYRVFVKTKNKDGTTQTWSLRTLENCQALLSTTAVGQMTATFADPKLFIREQVNPQAMDVVQVWTANRWGQSKAIWTGFVDEVTHGWTAEGGDTLTLNCTSPMKLWMVTHQTAHQQQQLAIAYMTNVAGSSVLKYSAQAVGFPPSWLRIDPIADSGSGLQQNINYGVFTDPDMQAWIGPIQQLLQSSGLEWFFDAEGYGYWRDVGFLNARNARQVDEEDILHADVSWGDQNAVTRLHVHTQFAPLVANNVTGYWQAPQEMEDHLGIRELVVYAPWITTKAPADWLARTLGMQYAAGLITGSMTIPADPLIGIGSVIYAPSLSSDHSHALYYVSSITYGLDWGGAWVMTLGLSYGRAQGSSFPYATGTSYPTLRLSAQDRAGLPRQRGFFEYDAGNENKIITPFTLMANGSLDANTAKSSDFGSGTVLQIYNGTAFVGPSHNGEYTITYDASVPAGTIQLKSTQYSTSTSVVQIKDATDPGLEETGGVDAGVTGGNGTGFAAGDALSAEIPNAPNTIPVQALRKALTRENMAYIEGHAGDDGWDCAGLVAWAYAQVGHPGTFFLPGSAGVNTDTGPQGIYNYMKSIGAKDIRVQDADTGDLLFIVEPQPWGDNYWASQQGFSHACFCLKPGVNYGADHGPNVITAYANNGFKSFNGTPINTALGMATARWDGKPVPSGSEPTTDQIMAMAIAAGDQAWGSGQGSVLWQIIVFESGGDPTAVNPTSGAAGLPQAYPASKLPCNYRHPISVADVQCQLNWMVNYITSTYKDAKGAWQHEKDYGSY